MISQGCDFVRIVFRFFYNFIVAGPGQASRASRAEQGSQPALDSCSVGALLSRCTVSRVRSLRCRGSSEFSGIPTDSGFPGAGDRALAGPAVARELAIQGSGSQRGGWARPGQDCCQECSQGLTRIVRPCYDSTRSLPGFYQDSSQDFARIVLGCCQDFIRI